MPRRNRLVGISFGILPGEDGGVLVVFGDVSGKGLKAAMTVSAIMGALRGCSLRSPAGILSYLNLGAVRPKWVDLSHAAQHSSLRMGR